MQKYTSGVRKALGFSTRIRKSPLAKFVNMRGIITPVFPEQTVLRQGHVPLPTTAIRAIGSGERRVGHLEEVNAL
jgi:hypothetical protein